MTAGNFGEVFDFVADANLASGGNGFFKRGEKFSDLSELFPIKVLYFFSTFISLNFSIICSSSRYHSRKHLFGVFSNNHYHCPLFQSFSFRFHLSFPFFHPVFDHRFYLLSFMSYYIFLYFTLLYVFPSFLC